MRIAENRKARHADEKFDAQVVDLAAVDPGENAEDTLLGDRVQRADFIVRAVGDAGSGFFAVFSLIGVSCCTRPPNAG